MNQVDLLNNFIVEGFEWQSWVIVGVMVATFVVQLLYRLLLYGRIASHRNPASSPEAEELGVSVIVPLFEADFGFLNERLPVLLAQKHKHYEVVLVNVTGDEEFGEQVKLLKITNPMLTSTVLRADPLFPITTKMALNVGIKAARYDNLIFTMPECMPRSERWAEMFARAFVGHDVVLGYTSLMPFKGLWNRLVRLANMEISARWIADGVVGHPWRGVISNLGFTKKAYYAARGFNFLNLNMGEDDLFVMKIASRDNTALTMGGPATMNQRVWGGYGWWREFRLSHAPTHRYYPLRARLLTAVELWSRVLFFVALVMAALFLPLTCKIVAGSALVLRGVVVMLVAARTARRLSEKAPLVVYPLYDLVSPLLEALLWIKRIVARRHTWRSKNT